MLGSVRTPSPERAQGRDDDVFSAFSARASAGPAGAPAVPAGPPAVPPAVPAPGAPRKPRPRAARHRDIHRRVVRRLHSALEALAGAGAERAEGAEPGATMSPEDALCGCTAAVEETARALDGVLQTTRRELCKYKTRISYIRTSSAWRYQMRYTAVTKRSIMI